MKPTRSLPPSLPAERAPVDHVLVADRRAAAGSGTSAYRPLSFCGPSRSMPSVLPSREKEWQLAQVCRPSISRRLWGSADVAQPPGDQRHGVGAERLDDALLRLRGHQRHVAVEDGRADRVRRGPDRRPGRATRPAAATCRVAGDREDGGAAGRSPLDRLPGRGVRLPGVRRGLLRRERGKLVRRADRRADRSPRSPCRLAARRRVQRRRIPAAGCHVDRPHLGVLDWRRATRTWVARSRAGRRAPSRG